MSSASLLMLAVAIAAFFGKSENSVILVLGLTGWLGICRIVRVSFMSLKQLEYVEAATALGFSTRRIMFRHILPNAMVASLTFAPFVLSGSIASLTSLDFLGFGLPPGSPSLGELALQGKNNPQAPWLGLSAFFVLALMLSLLVFAGEAIRDAFDPRKTFR